MPSPARRPARRSRPSYLALPPLLSELEPFEGAAILREHPGAIGTLLWKTLRDLDAWLETPTEALASLFPRGAGEAREAEIADSSAEMELWAPLLVVAQLLADPEEVDYPRLVNACRAVARWGERRAMPAVQLAFTQAAARLAPGHPRLAYAVGRLARDRGEYARAESWLRASIRLARGKDWHTYALAYLSLGTLYQQRGNLPAARAVTLRGYRTIRRRRVRALEGVALHNLFAITAEMLDFRRAHEYAREAFRKYGAEHPRFPLLVHDVGCFWVLHGCFDRAAEIFDSILPRIPDEAERLLALGNLARAAAGAGRAELYRRSRERALPLLADDAVGPERAAQVWLNLGRAAASMGEHDRADEAARRSLEICRAFPLGQLRLEAEALRDAVAAARRGSRAAERPVVPGMEAETAVVAELVLQLVGSG